MKKFLAIVMLTLATYAQAQTKIDSIRLVWENRVEEDSTRAKAFTEYIWKGILFSQPDSAFKLCEDLYNFSDSPELKVWQGEARKMQGISYYLKGDILKALSFYQLEYDINVELNDSLRISNAIGNMARVYSDRGKLDVALKMYLSEIEDYLKFLTPERLSYTHFNVGVIYRQQKRYEDAFEFLNLALQSAEKGKAKRAIALCYTGFADTYMDLENFELAAEYIKKSMKLTNEIGEKRGYIKGIKSLGEIQQAHNKPDSALMSFTECLGLAKEMNDKTMQSAALLSIAQIHKEFKQWNAAESNANASLRIARLTGRPSSIKSAAAFLKDFYWEQNKAKQALNMYELEIEMADSLRSSELTKQIAEADFEKAQFMKAQEKATQERIENEAISRRNSIQYSIIITGLFLFFGLLFILARIKPPNWVIELMVFLPFLIIFEFLLVITDPYVESISAGAPLIKLAINVALAAMIFPLHGFFERFLKQSLLRNRR